MKQLKQLKQFERIETIETIWNNFKQFYFHKTWYKIYMLHFNIIHKSTGVTWDVGPYKLIRLPRHPNLIKCNKYKIIAITILITLKQSYYNSLTCEEHTTNSNIPDYPDYIHKRNNRKFHSKILRTKKLHLKNRSCMNFRKKNNAIMVAPSISIF